MRLHRPSLRLAALAAAFVLGILAAPKAQAFTFENQSAGDGAKYTDSDVTSDRFGRGKATTTQQGGLFMEMRSYGGGGLVAPGSGPSDRNVNDLAPRYVAPGR